MLWEMNWPFHNFCIDIIVFSNIFSHSQGPTSHSFPAGQSFSVKCKMPQKRTTHGSSLKQSTTLLKGHSQTKGYMVQRQHPGMMSSQNRATAHYGAVIGLKVTSDGMYLLSAGQVLYFIQFVCFFLQLLNS